MTGSPRVVALVPARAGSKRLPNKNVKLLGGHPLLAYTVRAAIDSNVFDAVVCSTDSHDYAATARHYGAEAPFLRPSELAGDKSPDIEWIVWTLEALRRAGRTFDAFSILRPTSPFRLPSTINRAWTKFASNSRADSLRAIEKCAQHPGKMWVVRGDNMLPIMPYLDGATPWHSSQYSALPEVYVQNASLEIAWTRVALDGNTIAGETIIPFITEACEGFDVNEPADWLLAEHLVASGEVTLPKICCPAFRHG